VSIFNPHFVQFILQVPVVDVLTLSGEAPAGCILWCLKIFCSSDASFLSKTGTNCINLRGRVHPALAVRPFAASAVSNGYLRTVKTYCEDIRPSSLPSITALCTILAVENERILSASNSCTRSRNQGENKAYLATCVGRRVCVRKTAFSFVMSVCPFASTGWFLLDGFLWHLAFGICNNIHGLVLMWLSNGQK
jgi:hypothetical protein